MSKIRGKDTKIETLVRYWLHHHGIRYRKHCKNIAGNPDIAIKKYKIAIFVHGCFWHGHEDCKIFRIPKTRIEFWEDKINKNRDRDQKNNDRLVDEGWKVFVLWECQLKSNFEIMMDSLYKEMQEIKRLYIIKRKNGIG